MISFFCIKIYWRIVVLLLLLSFYAELGWSSRRILSLRDYILVFTRWWFKTASAAKIFINIVNLHEHFTYLLDFLIMMYSILFFKSRNGSFLFFLFFTFVITWREFDVVLLRIVGLLELLRGLNSHSSHVFVKANCGRGIGYYFIIRGWLIAIIPKLFDVICWSLLQCPCHCTESVRYRLFPRCLLWSWIAIFAIFFGKLTINELFRFNFLCWWIFPVIFLSLCVYVFWVIFFILFSV